MLVRPHDAGRPPAPSACGRGVTHADDLTTRGQPAPVQLGVMQESVFTMRSKPERNGARAVLWPVLLAMALLMPASSWSAPLLRTTPQPGLAIQHVSVITLDGEEVLRDQTVLARDGLIQAIAPARQLSLPAGTETIDGRGLYLLPGLTDAHVHLRKADEAALLRYLRAGVTTVRDMNGRPELLRWRERIAAGELVGPTLHVAAPTLGNFSSPREGYPTPTDPEAAKSVVRRFHADGYDWIKVYSFISDEVFHAVLEEAARLGMPVGGHPPLTTTFADQLRMRSVEHLLGYVEPLMTDAARDRDAEDLRAVFHAVDLRMEGLPELAAATAAAGTFNCPTIGFFDHRVPTARVAEAWRRPDLRHLGHHNRITITRALHEAGAPLVLCTDSDAGRDLPASHVHAEMAHLSEAGLTNFEVLRAATVQAAALLESDAFGMVAVGKRADLLLVPCNPLDDLSCLRDLVAVIAGGRRVATNLTIPERAAPHEIDALYVAFQRAYAGLDTDAIAQLYAEEAFYLQPGSPVRRGREAVRAGFAALFESVRQAGGRIGIEFDILDRELMEDAAVDVGVYRTRRDGRAASTGKFVVVAGKEDGRWTFRIDAFSPAPAEE